MSDTAPGSPSMRRNRLASATSPYLLQHALNPVDWYEWGREALRRSRDEDKPIFLSVGYSACHWCHVMAHESFENPDIAAVLNRLFVNIKVDREERPDIDEIYMQATLILNQGQGGWPMSVWLTPELKPFFAGTYFPPDSRWGRPGFRDLCERIGELWAGQRDALRADAEKLAEIVAGSLQPAPTGSQPTFSLEAIDRTADLLAGAFDSERGGLLSGGTNKFPPSMAMDLMLRSAHRVADPARRERLVGLVTLTLDRMAAGGIYDQLAGGIARYSTDVDWLVPHFEKMLYDQALVGDIYLRAWQLTRNERYAQVAREIFDYVITDFQAPGGGFYSARDADSEGEEGRYYVWTRDEVVDVLGQADGELLCSYFDVSEAGNWADPHAPGARKSVLHSPRDVATVARLYRLDAGQAAARIAAGRAKLLEARRRRVPPARDEKVLCEWNGLMIATLARGGAALGEPRYVEAARRAAGFILSNQYRGGRLLRAWREGRALESAFLSDYACMVEGLLNLYEAEFDPRWLEEAIRLNGAVVRHFADQERGGFYFTADDHEQLMTRPRDARDSAVPAGNSVQMMNLARLAVILNDAGLRQLAEASMKAFASDVLGSPGAGERFLAAVEFLLAGPVEVVVVGPSTDPRTRGLLRVVDEAFLPNRVLMLLDPHATRPLSDVPLLKERVMVDGEPTAYVCRGYACRRPVTQPDELAKRLAQSQRSAADG